jgi:prepilin peptidase CpaA
MEFYTGFPVIMAAVAVVMDLRTAKVDNGWILFSLIVGAVTRTVAEGSTGLVRFLEGAGFPLLVLGMLFWFRMLGAGDIKLFAAMGGVMGMRNIGKCILVSFFLGACISMTILISNGDIRQRILYLCQYFHDFIKTGERKPYRKQGMSHPENFHFTVPVLLSVLLYAGGVY